MTAATTEVTKDQVKQALLKKIHEAIDDMAPGSVLAYANAYAVIDSGLPHSDLPELVARQVVRKLD